MTEKEGGSLETLGKDTIFSAQQRFTIMFLLFLHKKAGFTELQKLLHLTPGNLDHHVRRLEEVGYVKTRHVLDWRPLKVIEISKLGSQEFRDYAINLKKILERVK